MKVLSLFYIAIQLISIHLFAQDTVGIALSKEDIIAIWQVNSPRVGNGYAECFSFFRDGTFIYQYDPTDDTRTILDVIGQYRLDKNRLYLTIKSRTERLGGKIMTGAVGTDEYLFVFDNNKKEQIMENEPKE